jgi:hypothetical protein
VPEPASDVKAMRETFGFPNPVNEKAARVFAAA